MSVKREFDRRTACLPVCSRTAVQVIEPIDHTRKVINEALPRIDQTLSYQNVSQKHFSHGHFSFCRNLNSLHWLLNKLRKFIAPRMREHDVKCWTKMIAVLEYTCLTKVWAHFLQTDRNVGIKIRFTIDF